VVVILQAYKANDQGHNDLLEDSDLGFIYRYQPAKDPAQPTLLLLHGTGGDENDLLPLGRLLAPEAGLLSPRGKVLEQGMPRFFRRYPDGRFDVEDVKLRARELADFVDAAAEKEGFERRSVVAAGYSNGANIAAAMLIAQPRVFAGAVLFHATLPYRPAEPADLTGVPVFLTGGRRDTMIPPEGTEALASLLREAGAEVTLSWQPGAHALTRDEVEGARHWLEGRSFGGS
jgi:phospholipase/carboxylesterase/glyoxalase family protein